MHEQLVADPDVISPLQVRLLRLIAEVEREYGPVGLRLEGGTALSAYYLRHRESEDLDLFGNPGLDARDFRAFVTPRLERNGLHVVRQGHASQGFAEMIVSDQGDQAGADSQATRVQFARTSPFSLEPVRPTAEGTSVASFRDVCAGKLHALCDRFEVRDFIDLHCIVARHQQGQGTRDESSDAASIRDLVSDLQECDPGLSPVQVGEALARGIDQPLVGTFPLRLLMQVSDAEVQRTIRLAVKVCADMAGEHIVGGSDEGATGKGDHPSG